MQTLYGADDDKTLRLLLEKLNAGGEAEILEEIAQLQHDFPLSINLFNFEGAIWKGWVIRKITRCYLCAILLRQKKGNLY